MLNFCNRADEVLERDFICCWMKITHSIERHWGHIKSESLTAAVITMLKAVAEHGSIEILRYTLKFWIGLPPKCNDLTPNLKHEIENMFVEMDSSLKRKEEKLKCNKNKTGSNKKRVSFADKPAVTTYSPVSVDPTHLNELSEKISSVKIQENRAAVTLDGEEDSSSLFSQNCHEHNFPEGRVVVNETPTVTDTVSQNESSDDIIGLVRSKNPFARSFFNDRPRRGNLMTTEEKTNLTVDNKTMEPLHTYNKVNVCKKDKKITLVDGTRTEQEGRNIDNSSKMSVQEKNCKSVADDVSSECDLEGGNDHKNHENSSDQIEAESDKETSGTQCLVASTQHNKSQLSLRKSHEMLDDKQRKLSVKTFKSDDQLDSNKSVPRIDNGHLMEAENDSITGKHLSINDGHRQNLDVKNSNTKEDNHSESSVNISVTETAEAKPLSLFGKVCERNIPKQQISPSVESCPRKEVPAQMESSEDPSLETLSDQNSQFAKPEEKCAVRRRKSLQATDFPVRHSPRRPLTKHQKECLKRKRDDIPALYCDLSEDSQSSTFSEMSQDDSQISIPERLSWSKPARPEEKQLSFAHLRRVTKPNSLSSLIQKTLEVPEEESKNTVSKGKQFSDAASPEAKVRKIDTADTEHKDPAGHERNCQVNVSLGHTLAAEDGSVLNLKDSTEHIAENQLDADAAAGSNNSVKDDKENSSSIKSVSSRTDNSEPAISSVRTMMSENSPNRRKSLRPLKRIIRNVGKNSVNNKVGHINKWRTQTRRELLHPLKKMVTNKGKNSKSSKFKLLQGGLLKDKKNLSPGCGAVNENTTDVSANLCLSKSTVLETVSISEKNQLNCSTSEATGINPSKRTTPSPLKDLTQSKIDKYTLRSRLSPEGSVPQTKKSVQHEHQQMKSLTSGGLSSSLLRNVEVSVEINQKEVQDAENVMRKRRVTEMVKSESNSKLEQSTDSKKTTVKPDDEVSVQLKLASTDKETAEKLIFESVPTGQQDDSSTEKSKSTKLRGRPRKSLSTKPETTVKDLCDVLPETSKHISVNANDKSSVSEEHPQNADGIKTRKARQRSVSEGSKTGVECDNQFGKAHRKEKRVTELLRTGDSDLSSSSKEDIHECTTLQSENEPCEESLSLNTVTVPNDTCRTEIDTSIISKDVSRSFPQTEEVVKLNSSDTLQSASTCGEEHEIKSTKDDKAGCSVNKTSGHLSDSVDLQQSDNLKLVSGPYVHLTNINAKSNVGNNFNEQSKCTVGSEEQKSLQQSCLDTEDFVEDSQDLTLLSNKRTRKWTRRASDGRSTRSSADSRAQQLITPGSNNADAPQLAKLKAPRANEEKGTTNVSLVKTTSESGCCEPINEITDLGPSFESTVKQNKSKDSYDSSDACVEEHSTASIPSVHKVNNLNDKEINMLHTLGTVVSEVKDSKTVPLQDGHNSDPCKDTVKPVGAKDSELVMNTADNTVVPKVAADKLHSSSNVPPVSTSAMRRSLRARKKSKSHCCLYSSCCRQVDTNKTRIARRITAKSLRLARQGQLQRAESPADSGSVVSKMNIELHGESDLQSARQKMEYTVQTESSLEQTWYKEYSKDQKEVELPETNSKTESGCLKRKSVSDEEVQKDDVSPKKQKKRVSFSDPDVSSTCYFEEYPIEEVHKDYQWIARSGGMEDEKSEDQLALDLEDLRDYSENVEEDTSLLDSQSPIWPSLAGCTYPVEEVVKFVVAPTWARNAVRYFEEQGIKTIGDISSMDEARISALPLREPKVAVVKRVLKVYEEKLNRIKAGATAAEVNSSRSRRKGQRIQRRGGLAAVIRKSDDYSSQKLADKNYTMNLEGFQNKSSEVGEMVFKSFGDSLYDNDRLQYHSEESNSTDAQKNSLGSGHSSPVQKADKILLSKLPNTDTDQTQPAIETSISRQCTNATKDETYCSGVSKSKNKISSHSSGYDECTKDLPLPSQAVEKIMNDDNAEPKDSNLNQTAASEDIETLNTKQNHQKPVQEELVVVSNETVTVRNLVKTDVGRTEERQEKVVPADSLVGVKEANENSTQWQDDVLNQKEFDSILGDWNIAMSDDLLEARCREILENGNCKEDSVRSDNEFTVSTNLRQARGAAVFASHTASGSGNKTVTGHHTVIQDEKTKDSVDCSIPELKTAIEKHSLVNVTREILRLWRYRERLRQDITVGNLLNRLENAEVTDLKQQTHSVAVQANNCLCDPQTISTFKMIYEKISFPGESKT
ncbi:telomere-associated protein RIF1-like [Schistocerca americana]|uniref:telomere-associated protein RIF1-like n=1 Tax=Schistocerca americana TaxID=7009 RepID=UPI001F4F332C|nr:telomere-associated protein RIF1-like [Schistocerca americana]